MPFLRKPPRGRRRANLQIDYPFDRKAYIRFRLKCWGGARLRQGKTAAQRVTATARATMDAGYRHARRIWGGAPTLLHRAGEDGPASIRQVDR